MNFMKKAVILAIAALGANAWDAAEKEAALKVVDEYGFPRLKAFDMMTPKLLLTVLKTYTTAMAPGAFEHFDAEAIETVYAAVSSSNNCEMCLSFHAMALGASASAEDIAEIVAGGLPKDPKMRTLVIASKYALAHKGIYLERERKHLAVLGIEGEKLVELTFLVGFMSAHNMNYVHLISMGLELEPMLQEVGPFAKTIYAKEGEL